ncbi:hypothetical protein GCM10010428_44050 [Actinosynnema pretiosum subsp. pretiosum]
MNGQDGSLPVTRTSTAPTPVLSPPAGGMADPVWGAAGEAKATAGRTSYAGPCPVCTETVLLPASLRVGKAIICGNHELRYLGTCAMPTCNAKVLATPDIEITCRGRRRHALELVERDMQSVLRLRKTA